MSIRKTKGLRAPKGTRVVTGASTDAGSPLEPLNKWPDDFLAMLGSVHEEIPRLPQEPLRAPTVFQNTKGPRVARGTRAVTSFPPEEVAVLEIKTRLMAQLTDIFDASGITRSQAARRFGVALPLVTALRKGKIDEFSIDVLVGMLARTGRTVRLVVRRR